MVGGKSQGKDNRRSDHGEEDMDAIEDQPSQDEKAHLDRIYYWGWPRTERAEGQGQGHS